MTDEQIIQGMAKSVRDPEWRHYTTPAAAAFEVAKAGLKGQRSADESASG